MNKTTLTILFFVLLILAFLFGPMAPLGKMVWPAPELQLAPEPTGLQQGLFMLLSIVEAIAFAGGITFLIYGWSMSKKVASSKVSAFFFHIALFWLLWSWWIHDILHILNGESTGGLLGIEYGFHVTSIIATLFVMSVLIKKFSERG